MNRSAALFSFIFIIGAAISNTAFAVGRLNVEFRYPIAQATQRADSGRGEMEMILRNEGDRPIDIPLSGLSIVNRKGKLLSDLFAVTGIDGRSVAYLGIFVDLDSNAEPNYMRIAPHAARIVKVNLALNYAVESGKTYTVSLKHGIRYLNRPRQEYAVNVKSDIQAMFSEARESSSLLIWIDTRMNSEKAQAILEDGPTLCEGPQVTAFNAAKTTATEMSEEALYHLSNLYSYDFVLNTIQFTPSSRYTKWFGMHGDPNISNADDDFVDSMVFISHIRISDDQSNPKPIMSVTCQCTSADGIDPANTVAWVTSNVHYVVNACPLFWAAPDLPAAKNENSKVGTIIHEATHFVDEWYGSAGHTYPDDYDSAAALVISNRSQAVRSANNYKFYVLNQSW